MCNLLRSATTKIFGVQNSDYTMSNDAASRQAPHLSRRLVPLARLLWKFCHDALGANPIEVITHSTGDWTLILI